MAREIRTTEGQLSDIRAKQAQGVCAEIRKLEAECHATQDAAFWRATQELICNLRGRLAGLHFAFQIVADKFTVDV